MEVGDSPILGEDSSSSVESDSNLPALPQGFFFHARIWVGEEPHAIFGFQGIRNPVDSTVEIYSNDVPAIPVTNLVQLRVLFLAQRLQFSTSQVTPCLRYKIGDQIMEGSWLTTPPATGATIAFENNIAHVTIDRVRLQFRKFRPGGNWIFTVMSVTIPHQALFRLV
jgi:hypothetical protein